ncbi:hypothetical protein ACN28S_35115 [Cystobacter fuscus]
MSGCSRQPTRSVAACRRRRENSVGQKVTLAEMRWRLAVQSGSSASLAMAPSRSRAGVPNS